jgi:multiple sugar transport system substrate-binding protein
MNLPQTRIHRRAFIGIGAGAVLATVGMRRESAAAGTPVVRFAYFGTAEEQTAYERLIATFEAAHPEIAIESIALPSGDATLIANKEKGSPYQPWLKASFNTDKAPDVFLLNYRNLGDFTTRGLIEPLDSYLASSAILGVDDLYQSALDAFRFRVLDGGTQLGGFPQNASSLVVYYNKSVFDELKVAYPSDSWTWEEFADTAASLTVDRNGDGVIGTYGLAIDPSIARFAAFIWGAGGEIVDDPVLPTELKLDSEAAQNGMRFLVSLGPSGRNVTPSEAVQRQETDLFRFMNGGAAMFVHTRRIVPTLRAQQQLRWDVAPLPIGKQPANVLHTDGFCMSAISSQKEAAWTFIEFANGPDGQKVLAATGRTVPSLRTVAESDVFLKGSEVTASLGLGLTLPPERTQVFLDNIAISRPLPAISSWPGIEYAFNRSFKQAYYKDGDIPHAIQQTVTLSQGLLGTSLTTGRNLYLGEASEAEE